MASRQAGSKPICRIHSKAAQAAAWTVQVHALWILLLGRTAVRTAEFPKLPGYLGVFLGIVGSLTLIPAVAEPMFMIFGPGMMIMKWLK